MFAFSKLSPETLAIVVAVTALFLLLSWWSIRDAFRREFASTNEKIFWVQLSVLVPFLGGIVYFLVGSKRGKKLR